MSETRTALDRVEGVLRGIREREAAGRSRAYEAGRLQQEARVREEAARGKAMSEDAERQRREGDARAVISDSLARCETALRAGLQHRDAFQRDHRRRRDVVDQLLEDALARVDSEGLRRQRRELVDQAIDAMLGPVGGVSVDVLIRLAGLGELARARGAADVRRLFEDAPGFSSLDSDEVQARVAAARVYRLEIEATVMAAREFDVPGALNSRDPLDVAGDVLDLAERAETSFERLRGALDGVAPTVEKNEPTDEETPSGDQ